MSIITKLTNENTPKFSPPKWMHTNMCYETIMGSQAYGMSSENSDTDIYGITMPLLEDLFPSLGGDIHGFGRQKERFSQFQQHHLMLDNKEYDITVFSIARYFHLAMENNPNVIDSLFVPRNCILKTNLIGEKLRENRRMFLHKGSFHRYKGYSFSQVHKSKEKNPVPGSKRYEDIQKHGFDTKFLTHAIRLLSQCEQILMEGDLDLQRNNEMYKAIRRGEWSHEDCLKWITQKEHDLESLYVSSKLPHGPDEDAIKKLLLECIEHHYGKVTQTVMVSSENEMSRFITGLKDLMVKHGIK